MSKVDEEDLVCITSQIRTIHCGLYHFLCACSEQFLKKNHLKVLQSSARERLNAFSVIIWEEADKSIIMEEKRCVVTRSVCPRHCKQCLKTFEKFLQAATRTFKWVNAILNWDTNMVFSDIYANVITWNPFCDVGNCFFLLCFHAGCDLRAWIVHTQRESFHIIL